MEIMKIGRVLKNNIVAEAAKIPVRSNTNESKLAEPLSKDTVDISNKIETCLEEFYHKVECWTPIDKHFGFPNVYEIPEDYIGKGHIYIEKIVAGENRKKGTGIRTIQRIVRESLADPQCEGRIRFEAMPIDIKKGSALGLFYKLGFRPDNIELNKKLAQWLAEGGEKSKTPISIGANMYLPKENIEHCLNYKIE